MSKKNDTGKNRKPAKKKPAGTKKGKSKTGILKIIFSTFAVLFLLGALFFILVFLGFFGPVPSKNQLLKINNPVASEVLSHDGKVLGRYYVQNRSNVGFTEISENVVNALIATEDARFYEHRGIDEIALLRVFVKSILLGDGKSGGGSTLSQQVAKNLYPRVNLGPFSMPVNKLRESIIAYRLENIYDKKEILALYLNTVPFAENIFGIEVAAERFFSKSPKNLDVDEAAVLVGMLKANNYFNPRTNPERAKGRRDVVIDQMLKENYITAEEAEKYKAKPLDLKYRLITYNQGPATYFLEKLRPQLVKWCESNTKENGENYNLYTDGLRIKTTIDYNLQYYAVQSVNEYMKSLQNVFDNHWKNRDMFREDPDILKSATRRLKSELGSDINLEEKKATQLFTWDGIMEKEVSRLDSLKHYLKLLNVGFMAVDPGTSELKAYVGGIDFRFFKYDHATAPRQTGSAFKPFVYLAALENDVRPDKYFPNTLKTYEEYQNWTPRNSHDEYGGYYTMKGALANSLNTISVEVLLEAGISNAIDVARELGISADLPDYPSLALGVASISLEEMVEAFAGIVNNGAPVKSHYLLEIADSNGKTLESFAYEVEDDPVVTPENCRAVINMMQGVVEAGTGKAIRTVYNIPGDFAGKTGTTQDNSDGWFIGITPRLVTGCWVGADDPRIHFRTTNFGQGAYMALPIVGKFFNKAYRDPKFANYQYARFTPPEPELLALLDMPPYQEVMDIDKREFNIAEIFKKKSSEENLKDVEAKEVPPATAEKDPIWIKIKSIFKKKEK